MSNDLVVTTPQHNMVQLEKYAMSPSEIKEQIGLIQHIMKDVMQENVHYGIIPGTDKPTLYQAGAEKLMLTFRFRVEFEIADQILEKDFISYTTRCKVYHIPTNQFIASGLGSCNSRETKYRYRNVSTGVPVPAEYWKARNKGDFNTMKALLGGDFKKAEKKDGAWVITEKVEHDNPWDFQNTLLKMSAKRSKVASILNATAASDIFTQDIEDLPKEFFSDNINRSKTKEKNNEKPSKNNYYSKPKTSKTSKTSPQSDQKPSDFNGHNNDYNNIDNNINMDGGDYPDKDTLNNNNFPPPKSSKKDFNNNFPLSSSRNEAKAPPNKKELASAIEDMCGKLYHGEVDLINEYLKHWLKGKIKTLEALDMHSLNEIHHELKVSLRQGVL